MMGFKTNTTLDSTSEIKREAKAQLKGKWGKMILLCLVPLVLSLLIVGDSGLFIELIINSNENGTFSSTVSSFVSFLNQFIYIGIVYTLIDYIRQQEPIAPLKEAFQVFTKKYFLADLVILILRNIYIFLWSLLLLIPGIIKSYAYSQSFNVYKDMTNSGREKGVTANQAITESRRIMDGHKIELFKLELSFVGWWILSIFTLGILLLWVIPYYQMCKAAFYQNLVKKRDDEDSEFSDF